VTSPLARAERCEAVGQQPASQEGLEFIEKKKQARGTPSFQVPQLEQGPGRMGDPEPMFTERWHCVRGSVFALRRDPNSGETRESAVRVNQWEIGAAPEQYRIRMGWWWLTPGQRVFSLVMGRHPACADQILYHMHPSRYTVATVDWFQGPDRHSKVRYFDLLIDLDGVGVDVRGGVYSNARDGWHVFSEEVAPYVSGGRAGASSSNRDSI
jgi:hypothetical protein